MTGNAVRGSGANRGLAPSPPRSAAILVTLALLAACQPAGVPTGPTVPSSVSAAPVAPGAPTDNPAAEDPLMTLPPYR
jgi:hypothetical protein